MQQHRRKWPHKTVNTHYTNGERQQTKTSCVYEFNFETMKRKCRELVERSRGENIRVQLRNCKLFCFTLWCCRLVSFIQEEGIALFVQLECALYKRMQSLEMCHAFKYIAVFFSNSLPPCKCLLPPLKNSERTIELPHVRSILFYVCCVCVCVWCV